MTDPVRALGDQLERAGYLNVSLPEAVHAEEPLASLTALFALGSPVPRAALAGVDAAALEAEGLLAGDGEHVQARLRISVWNGRLMAHDPGGPPRAELVPEPRESAQTLAHLTVRRAGQSVLDLGCGSGCHAVLAAGHASRVVATDLNPRAVMFTRLTARLNGAGVVEARVGDLFEPVAGERFGLIVSNPPYVISPDADLLYRDSGQAPGELCRRIVGGAGEHLEEGGMATVLCSWGTGGGDPWDTVRGWVADSGCDACLVSYGPQDVVEYATRWTGLSAGAYGAVAQAEAIARWVRFYAEVGIEAIWFGALVLRRRADAGHWFAAVDAVRPPSANGGAQLERIFAAHDALDGRPDDALLERSLVPAAPHRLVHALNWDGEGYAVGDIRLVLDDDIGVDGVVDPLAVHVLPALDGRPLRAVIEAVAAERGLDGERLAAGSLPSLRRLYERGFLFASS
jgi:methylase of polypeptide subunit release factors